MTPKCPACGSETLSGETAVVMSTKGGMSILLKDPNAIFMETEYTDPKRARICLSCGYLMLFMEKSLLTRLKKGELLLNTDG